MAEEKKIEVTLKPRPEEVVFLCGLTRADNRIIDYIHDTVDTLHSMCAERTGMAEQVKPAVTFGLVEACELRDLLIENARKYLRELLERAKKTCP